MQTNPNTTETFQLSNGAVIVEQPTDSGARLVTVANSDRELTESEWQEYCNRTVTRRLVRRDRQSPLS